jgi:hypothetical protein
MYTVNFYLSMLFALCDCSLLAGSNIAGFLSCARAARWAGRLLQSMMSGSEKGRLNIPRHVTRKHLPSCHTTSNRCRDFLRVLVIRMLQPSGLLTVPPWRKACTPSSRPTDAEPLSLPALEPSATIDLNKHIARFYDFHLAYHSPVGPGCTLFSVLFSDKVKASRDL